MMIDILCDAYDWITGWHIYSFDDPTLVFGPGMITQISYDQWISLAYDDLMILDIFWHIMINEPSTSQRYFLGFVYMYVYGMSSVCKTETYPLVI